jgi:D-serine deaminase-like pyridoxal phosphate-dependent protein
VLDVGSKAADLGSGPPTFAGRATGAGVAQALGGGPTYTNAGDEHGTLDLSGGTELTVGDTVRPRPATEGGGVRGAGRRGAGEIGGAPGAERAARAERGGLAQVWLVPGHCDPTVAKHLWLVGHRAGRVERLFAVHPGF